MSRDKQQINDDIKSLDPEARLHAIEKMAEQRDAGTMKDLIGLMGDPEWRVRKSAVMAVVGLEHTDTLINELISVLDHAENVGKKNAAEEALTHMGERGLLLLLAHLPKANEGVKKMIIEVLGELGDKRAATTLWDFLEDSDENVRLAAIESLGKMKDVNSVGRLIPQLESDQPLVGFITVKALERIGDPRALEPLIQAAKNKSTERVALEALGAFDDPRVLDPIIGAVCSGSRKIKESALKGLMDYFDRVSPFEKPKILEKFREKYNPNDAEFLIAAMEHSDERIKLSAIRLLGWVKEPKAVKKLIEFIDSPFRDEAIQALLQWNDGMVELLAKEIAPGNEIVREGIAQIFGEIGGPQSIQALIRMLQDSNGHVRQRAALCLGKTANLSAADSLLNLLSDPYPSVQAAAVEALGHYEKDKNILSRLFELLKSPHGMLRASAVQILGRMKASEAFDPILFSLKDEKPEVRKAGVEALGFFENPDVPDRLAPALADEDKTVRLAALSALLRHPKVDLFKHIDPLLKDDNIWVRVFAARGLAGEDTEQTRKFLYRVLEDRVGVVQIAAMESLGRCKDRLSAPRILEMTHHPDLDVAKVAITVLGELGEIEMIDRLRGFLKHNYWGIRVAATQTLAKLKDFQSQKELERMANDDPDGVVKNSAQKALASFKGPF